MKKSLSAIFIIQFLLLSKTVFALNLIGPALIPMPQKVEWSIWPFVLPNDELPVVSPLSAESLTMQELTAICKGSVLKTVDSESSIPEKSLKIILRKTDLIKGDRFANGEAYELLVKKDNITLLATCEKGFYRGIQTLKQLFEEKNGKRTFYGCHIVDWPAFEIRGFMQDVGRNYMSAPMLKEQIEVMASYKYNVFHLHLTDNQAWRLESKIYPQLKDPASMSRWEGKYYTQQEFLELVDFCNKRFITLIPEFDLPGHSEAFRKAMRVDSMSDVGVKPILLKLVQELCDLAPKELMPYIHLGTDEVRRNNEKDASGLISALIDLVHKNGREVIVWRPGQVENNTSVITQLWSSKGQPQANTPYLDSRLNYLNHLDPLAGMWQLYFDAIGGMDYGDALCKGGILCCWNDNNVSNERDILRMNPVYPGMLVYSECSWKGSKTGYGDRYLANLPHRNTLAYFEFQSFENRLIIHRDKYFNGKYFPYVRNSQIPWSLIGPFNHEGNMTKSFPVENEIQRHYDVKNGVYTWWGPEMGGTLFFNHFFGYPSLLTEKEGTMYALTYIHSPKNKTQGFWIGFQGWSRSGGRRGGPLPTQGQWHTTYPLVWVNDKKIPPPAWEHPEMDANTEEIPFSDEDYFYRKPVKIDLESGWNKVLIKIPQGGSSWKWMFTFIPVEIDGVNVREAKDLHFSINPKSYID